MIALINALKQYLANTIVYKSASHGYHWNVEGPLFTQYHAFFKEIYEDLDDTIDTISEWLRKFDVIAPYTLTDFVSDWRGSGDGARFTQARGRPFGEWGIHTHG